MAYTFTACGTGAERGAQLGQHMGPALEEAWTKWVAHFTNMGYDAHALADRLTESSAWATAESHCPDLLAELQSLSSASGVSWTKVAALSMLDESWAMTGGMACTAITVTGDQRAAGQNMDLPGWTNGSQTILNVRDADGLGVIAATYPGSLATCGVNSNGVIVVVNALDLATNESGLAVDFVTRGALHQPTAKDAVTFVRSVPHGVGQNYTILDATDFFMVEADANGVIDVPQDIARGIHTNHAFTRTYEADESSQTRFDSVAHNREAITSAADIMRELRDPTNGVCTINGRWGRDLYSFMGIVGDALTGQVWVNSTPADGSEFEPVSFTNCQTIPMMEP